MFRMSDIYDKFKDDGKHKRPKPHHPSNEDTNSPAHNKDQPDKEQMRSPYSEVSQKKEIHIQAVTEKDRGLYSELCLEARRIYGEKSEMDPAIIPDLNKLIEKTVDVLEADSKSLMKLCLDDYTDPQEYFFFHIANVAVLSLELAKGLDYDKKGLVELGVAAFLHDIGIIKYENVIGTSKALTSLEYDAIKNHPVAGLEALEKLGKAVTPTMRNVVYQEHERIDGSGYPEALKGSQICEQAQVVGLIDVYEALTHQRPYMNKRKIEAIRAILAMKSAFDPKLVKVLLERVGIFPVGVFVRLNTKEVGIVVENNTKLPFRPIVKIMYDTEGRQLKEPKLVNLADNSVIFIHECTETPPPGTR